MGQLTTFANTESLLNANIEDLADLAGFEVPPPGAYVLSVSAELKKVNSKDVVEAAYEVVETSELESMDSVAVPNGTKFSTIFMLDNEFGVGNLKKFLKPFAAHFGTGNMGQLISEIKGIKIAANVKNRKDKNDPERKYAEVNGIAVA